MNVLSLFAGIGGLELGLERAGMTVVGQVEIDEYCRRVLAKHWPEVPRHNDVRTCVEWWTDSPCDLCGGLGYVGGVTGDCYCRRSRRPYSGNSAVRSFADGKMLRRRVDVICGGFPCQDISNAGRRAGIGGTRSGLWSYMADAVRVLRPRYVVMENVSAVLVRGLDVVTADLASCGYDAQWDCIPAAAVGAPHRRDRWWGIAYRQGRVADSESGRRGLRDTSDNGATYRESDTSRDGGTLLANSAGDGRRQGRPRGSAGGSANGQALGAEALADADTSGWDGRPWIFRARRGWGQSTDGSRWAVEPDVGRVAHGIPNRVDRLRALGNAVVPQVAEHIGRLLMDFDAASEAA